MIIVIKAVVVANCRFTFTKLKHDGRMPKVEKQLNSFKLIRSYDEYLKTIIRRLFRCKTHFSSNTTISI